MNNKGCKFNIRTSSWFTSPFSYKPSRIIIGLLMLIAMSANASEITHPHIIVKESEYAELQARAENWPWSVMKSKAISDATSLTFNPSDGYSTKCYRIQDIASSCALAYILDPANRSTYVSKVETVLAPAIDNIRNVKENSSVDDHLYSVTPSSPTFMVYLALDIMYDSLSTDIRQAIEEDCDYIASNHWDAWRESKYAIEGIMELYHNGNTALFEEKKESYRSYILEETTSDGVFTTGPGYTKSRLFMDKRIQKKLFMDVCEYQGYHEFYSDPKFQNLHEWIMGYIVTYFNRAYTFGDTPPTKDLDHWAVSVFRAPRFSRRAQQYAAWHIGTLTDNLIKGRLLHYVLCDSIPLPPVRPPSRIFQNGGAWLLEDSDSDRGLSGALWNIQVDRESHTHKDVNAIHIAAYGEHVIRNSGYDGYGEPENEWSWIRSTSESSNTVMINNQDHLIKQGGGITEGLVGGDLEYASGSSGYALASGRHQRNFIFVKPQDGKNGYFILIDEVSSAFFSTVKANVALHPNSSSNPTVVADGKEYKWDIGGCNYSGHPVAVTIFLGTNPSAASVKTGYKGSYDSCSRYYGKYLYSTYDADSDGKASIVSVVFPHDASHVVADMSRIVLTDASGAIINHGDSIIDYALGSQSDTVVTYEAVSFDGMAAVYRNKGATNQFYFVRKGTLFDDHSISRIGFDSNAEISLFIDDKHGKIISPGTEVTFYYPEITGVKQNDSLASILESGPGWITINVESGTHDIQLISDVIINSEEPLQIVRSFELQQNYPNPFNPMTTIRYDLSKSGHVSLKIYNLLGQEIETLVNGWCYAGRHEIKWAAEGLTSGIYFYNLRAGEFSETRKFVLQK
ncbi:MAG: T9SS type A sorting domain-containing protein [Fidelibacterota bacterium]|nr:MAG: T9SS type A sorting domain-containing protein [Candidatus Neomarinimicrobiota bacterium]